MHHSLSPTSLSLSLSLSPSRTMGSKSSVALGLLCILMVILFSLAKADLDKDREQCANQLIGLATCLPYVGGEAKAPTIDCCSGLKTVLQNSKICLCILVKDRNDPNLGLKINATLALGLPDSCHAPVNISECISLLHLAPHSPDAKVFEDFVNNSKKSNSTTPASVKGNSSGGGSSAEIKSDGGRGKKCLGVEMVWGLLIIVMFNILPNF